MKRGGPKLVRLQAQRRGSKEEKQGTHSGRRGVTGKEAECRRVGERRHGSQLTIRQGGGRVAAAGASRAQEECNPNLPPTARRTRSKS